MLQLTLMRHAHASYDIHNDFERFLSAEGRAQATKVGRELKSDPPDLVLTSSSMRTIETAERVVQTWHNPIIIPEPEIYHADSQQLLDLLNACDIHLANHILLIGHNPTISEFVFALQEGEEVEFHSLRPAEYVRLNLSVEYWKDLRFASAKLYHE